MRTSRTWSHTCPRSERLLGGEPPVSCGAGRAVLCKSADAMSSDAPAPSDFGPRPEPTGRQGLLLRMHAQLGPRARLAEDAGRVGAALGLLVHLVGGGVRDLLLGRPVLDVDLVVEGDAGALARALARRRGGRAVFHPAFGTAKWVTEEGLTVDLAGARSEHYAFPAALPEVSPAALGDDLARRDFSINAMALGLHPDHLGHLEDPHGGCADLAAGQLRVLHPRSFVDDPTRMFRAARFEARFGFVLESRSAALLQQAVAAGSLGQLGAERLGSEVDRVLQEATAPTALARLETWGLLSLLSPDLVLPREFAGTAAEVRALAERLSAWTGTDVDVSTALWVVLGGLVPPATRRTRLVPGPQSRQDAWLRAPEAVREAARRLQGAQRRCQQARALQTLSLPALAVLGATGGAPVPVLAWWGREGRGLKTAVDGHQLMAAGVPRGPALGVALAAAQDAAWDGAGSAAQLAAALRAIN